MPRCFVPRLERLCVDNLVAYWDTITANYDEECIEESTTLLQCLPEYLLHEVQRRLVFVRGVASLGIRELCLLVNRPLIRVNLLDFSLSKPDSLKALKLLLKYGRTLQEITFSNCVVKFCCALPKNYSHNASNQLSPHSDTLNLLLQSLPNLKKISFRSTRCQNWMLRTIAKNCPNLQEVDLTHCHDVDDGGITCFCDQQVNACNVILLNQNPNEDKIKTRSPIKLRKLWLVGTKVTGNGVSELLLSFPILILCHHPDLLNSLYFVTGPQWTSQTNQIDVNPLLTNIVCHASWTFHLHDSSQLTRSITCLELCGLTADANLSFLAQLNNLVSLTLRSCPSERKCGVNLDSLVNFCHRLRNLTLKVKGPLIVTRSFCYKAFYFLESLDVDRGGCLSLSATDALRLLVGCVGVTRLRLNSCHWLTDKILDDLLRHNPLAHAKEIALYDSKLSYDGITRLLHLPNKLFLLSIGTELIGKKHFTQFNNYIRKKNWNLVLRLFTNFPPAND